MGVVSPPVGDPAAVNEFERFISLSIVILGLAFTSVECFHEKIHDSLCFSYNSFSHEEQESAKVSVSGVFESHK